jgi:Tol biopolymer transport system component
MMKKYLYQFCAIFIFLLFLTLSSQFALALDAAGYIVYQVDGALYSVQPDGRGDKKIIDKVDGQAVISPDGKKIAYFSEHSVFIKNLSDEQAKAIYIGKPGDIVNIITWMGENGDGILFRKILSDKKENKSNYYYYNIPKGTIKDLGIFYEPPIIQPKTNSWVYPNLKSGSDKNEIFAGKIDGEGRYVFTGKILNVLSWEAKNDVLLYSFDDKIHGYDVNSRERQLIKLPFKDVNVVAYCYPTLLYYQMKENESQGLQLFDPERNEQKEVVDSKKTFYLVTSNGPHDKVIVFAPDKANNLMGEGELFLVETKKGESIKLTKDLGRRVFNEISMRNQWSPDGKYFVYEKMRLKKQRLRKSDIYIAGEGKDEKLFQKGKPYGNFAMPTWGEINK